MSFFRGHNLYFSGIPFDFSTTKRKSVLKSIEAACIECLLQSFRTCQDITEILDIFSNFSGLACLKGLGRL